MKSSIKIEKNVPLSTHRMSYPLMDMKVGDSFAVPEGKAPSVRQSIGNRKDRKKKFTVLKNGKGYRCWRTK